MVKKFRCGRLLLTRDGRVKKLDLESGGGTRTCDWTDDYMTLDDVHNQLLTVFSLVNKKQQTSLYDFQHQSIDLKQFKTFTDYINKYGLNRNSTVIYLCTSEIDNDTARRIQTVDNNNLLPIVKNEREDIPLIESKPLSTSVEYSFIDASNELMKNIRELINQNPTDKVLIRLFEKLCLINGYVFSIIVPLQQQQQQQQQSNETEIRLYLNNLNHIYDIFESTKSLLRNNNDRFRPTKLFSTIRSSFFKFHNNVKIVRNRAAQTNSSPSYRSNIAPSRETNQDNNSMESSISEHPEPVDQKINEKTRLFRPVMDRLHAISRRISNNERLLSLYQCVRSSIIRTKKIQLEINLSDESSMCDGKKVLLSVKSQFSFKYREAYINPSKFSSDQILIDSCDNILKQLRILISSIDRSRRNISQEIT